jgi:hypothetical protein
VIKNLLTLPLPLPLPLHPRHHHPRHRHHRHHIKRLKRVLFVIYLSFLFFLFYLHLSIILQKEVFIWIDSELKDIYEINEKQTWAEQKDNIITKLLPPLYKLINKKYSVSNAKLLKMLYGR